MTYPITRLLGRIDAAYRARAKGEAHALRPEDRPAPRVHCLDLSPGRPLIAIRLPGPGCGSDSSGWASGYSQDSIRQGIGPLAASALDLIRRQ